MSNIISRGRNYELNMDWKYIDALNKTKLIKDFFNISAKYNKGIDLIINYYTIFFLHLIAS